MIYATDMERQLQETVAECERLRSENADLKTKLGLEVNPQTADSNPSATSTV